MKPAGIEVSAESGHALELLNEATEIVLTGGVLMLAVAAVAVAIERYRRPQE